MATVEISVPHKKRKKKKSSEAMQPVALSPLALQPGLQSPGLLSPDEVENETTESHTAVLAATPAAKPAAQTVAQNEVYPFKMSWASIAWLVVVHAGALAAPFFFSWQGLALAVFLHWLTGGVGICLGYHRLFTHSGFKTSRPVRGLIAWLGTMAGQGTPIEWVADHRKHHAHSDQEGDPHSPHDGGWWAHMLWLSSGKTSEHYRTHVNRWAPDLLKEPFLRFLSSTFLYWHIASGVALYLIGWLTSGPYMGFSLLFWGLFARIVFTLHSTWFVNSASHMWGYRNYETTDDSRNNWWVALITYGEGWHNNHHAHPRMAKHGHKWWEVDVTFALVRLMERLGLAWDVVDYKHVNEKKSRSAA